MESKLWIPSNWILVTSKHLTSLNVFKFKTGVQSTIANIGLDYFVVDPRSKISLVKHVQKFNQNGEFEANMLGITCLLKCSRNQIFIL